MTVYRIKNWAELFETSESRKRVSLPWVAIPTKHDGKGYRRLMREFGPAVYGAWILICAVAAKCPTRGVLADADGPLSALDIADKTDCPVSVIEQALSALTNERIGWLELANLPGQQQIGLESAGTPADGAGTPVLPDQTGPDRTRQIPVTGVFSKQSGKAKMPLDNVTAEDLRDDRSLSNWFSWQAEQPGAVLEATEANLLLVFGAAERALEKATKNPVGMFVTILTRKLWANITQAQEDRASKRLAKLKQEVA